MTGENLVPINSRIPEKLQERLKIYSAKNKKTIQAILTEIIEEKLDKEEKKK